MGSMLPDFVKAFYIPFFLYTSSSCRQAALDPWEYWILSHQESMLRFGRLYYQVSLCLIQGVTPCLFPAGDANADGLVFHPRRLNCLVGEGGGGHCGCSFCVRSTYSSTQASTIHHRIPSRADYTASCTPTCW